MKNQKGFTLIELLVVIAIIGLLSTLAVVALNNARAKSRDAKRVSDIKQLQTSLELFFADNNAYPVEATDVTLGVANTRDAFCSSLGFTDDCSSGGTVYMGSVPQNPTPAATNLPHYTYNSAAGVNYTLEFGLENVTGGLGAGLHTASEAGIN